MLFPRFVVLLYQVGISFLTKRPLSFEKSFSAVILIASGYKGYFYTLYASNLYNFVKNVLCAHIIVVLCCCAL